MTALPGSTMHQDPQLSCKLLCTPLEIRQTIYAYLVPYGVHVSVQRRTVILSACVQPLPNVSMYGYERSGLSGTEPVDTPDPLLIRRLQSTWGPHWECEEVALRVVHSVDDLRQTDLGLLQVCKRL